MTENRQMLVASLPTGALSESDFELVRSEVPTAGDGEVLVRTLAITIGAGQRAGLQGSASYAGPAKTPQGMASGRRARAASSPSTRRGRASSSMAARRGAG